MRIYWWLKRCVFICIHQAEGKNKNGPTIAEYSDVQKRTAPPALSATEAPFRNVKRCAKVPAKRDVMNIAAN